MGNAGGDRWLGWTPERAAEPWLWGVTGAQLRGAVADRVQWLQGLRGRAVEHRTLGPVDPLRLVLCATDPLEFWADFWAATIVPSVVFLANPAWQGQEWRQVLALARPHGILGECSEAQGIPSSLPLGGENGLVGKHWTDDYTAAIAVARENWTDDCKSATPGTGATSAVSSTQLQAGWILMSTGGSSGQLRFVVHTLATLGAAVWGLQRSALIPPPGQIHSFCTLPFHHVSGLMQGLRSWGTGGQMITLPFRSLEQRLAQGAGTVEQGPIDRLPFCLSLVPTQLQRLLELPAAAPWLAQFAVIFLGGAPPWPSLLDRARVLGLPLAPTYGMTETAAMVTVLAPADFGRGRGGCGPALPHVRLGVGASGAGTPGTAAIGPIEIQTPALGLGYYSLEAHPNRGPSPAPRGPENPAPTTAPRGPENPAPTTAPRGPENPAPTTATLHPQLQRWTRDRLVPDDVGRLDEQGYLEVLGRESDKVITGGENVFPAEVEAVIRASGLVADVAVMGRPDPVWGERLVAVYVPRQDLAQQDLVRQDLAGMIGLDAIGPKAIEAQLKTQLQQWVRRELTAYKCPKEWWAIEAIDRNAQGKIDRQALKAWLGAVHGCPGTD